MRVLPSPTNWIIVDGDGNGNKWNHTTAQNHTPNGSRSAYHGWGDGLTYEKGGLLHLQLFYHQVLLNYHFGRIIVTLLIMEIILY